jgi:diguanylate cyclase (GGDEF)-like protein/PAS domain S-box-containing protein
MERSMAQTKGPGAGSDGPGGGERPCPGPTIPSLRAAFDHAPVGMALVGRGGRFVEVNRSLCTLLGYPAEELLAMTTAIITNPADLETELAYVDQMLRGKIHSYRLEKRWVAADGRDVWVMLSCSGVGAGAEPDFLLLQMEDLTAWKRTEQELMHRAFHDPLTDLPNRSLLMDRLSQALARSGRRQSSVAVLFIDLDQFKVVNDELGHDAGDRMLAATAARLRGVTRAHDTVARLGGDEFVMLLEDVDGEFTARAIAERILRAVSAPLAVERGEARTTASVGIALASGDHDRPESLIEHADRAMYRAKTRGGDRYELFAPERGSVPERGPIEKQLRQAIELGELRLVYQPLVQLDTGAISGVEALVRWEHPDRGELLPSEFIPAAEESGLIVELGRWVLEEALQQAARWRNAGDDPLTVNVNVATAQLAQGDFPRQVASALEESGLSPSSLCLEIDESAIRETLDLSPTWQELGDLGVRLHVDDFGTDLFSVRSLRQLPVDAVTIDRSFVAGLGRDTETTAVVQAVVRLADTLHLKSIGEGVETAEQASTLRRIGCTLGQGYFFARPQPAEAVEELLERGPV